MSSEGEARGRARAWGGGCGITERAWGLESAKTRFGALPPQGDPRAEVP